MQKYIFLAGGAFLFLVIGILVFGSKTSEQGDASNPLTPARSFSHSHGIAVDVVDSNKVYIATHEGLFLLANDTDLFQIGKMRDDLMGFSPHPTEANVFFSSGHPARGGNIGFQKTTDGGMSWEKVSPGLGGPVDFHSMAVSTANPSIVYGFFGGRLQRSVDAGESWEYAKGTIAPISLTTHPENANKIYAATQNGVLTSNDRGDTWTSVSSQLEGGAVSVFALNPIDSNRALAFAEKLGGLGISTDGGASWQAVTEKFNGDAVLYLAHAADASVVYALTDNNSVYKSGDQGEVWSKVK